MRLVISWAALATMFEISDGTVRRYDKIVLESQTPPPELARYADDFIVTVKSANAAKRVMASLIRFCGGQLQLVVNRVKSRAAPLKTWEFLGYRLNNRAKLAWTEKAQHRFKQQIREITSRNRGHHVRTVIYELNLYVRGWLNYYKLSSTYSEVKALAQRIRRRVRLYYWTAKAAIAAPAKCEAIPQIVPQGG